MISFQILHETEHERKMDNWEMFPFLITIYIIIITVNNTKPIAMYRSSKLAAMLKLTFDVYRIQQYTYERIIRNPFKY